jgi:TP901 family phage tail tape measure protein
MCAQPVIIEVKANASQARSQLDGLSKSFRQFGASVRSVVAMSSQAVSGVRQMAQGVQNLGFVLSGLIGIPAAKALKDMAEEATSFEEKMIEVQRTSGLTTEQIKILSDGLREMSKVTPTTALALADIAAGAGRAGVGLGSILAGDLATARKEMIEFIEVVDKMQVATTLTPESATKAFGRFITLFKDIDTTNIENLGSAINELGQSASVTEDEIVSAMLRIAPAGIPLDMTAAQVAALGTAIVQMSESAARGGTRARSAIEQMIKNWDMAAKLMGVSVDVLEQRLGEDAMGLFMEMVQAIGQIESKVQQITVAQKIFGTTGANAVQRLAESWPELAKYVSISNRAFEEGTSLQMEFDRALTSTTSQFDILKNNIIDVGKAFINDLLPVAREIMMALIPAIQELGKFVESLSLRQKVLIAGVTVLGVVAMPLIALMGSLGFAFAMVLNGAVNLIGGLVGLVASVMTFGSGISSLAGGLGTLLFLIGTALVAGVAKATGSFDSIAQKLDDIADKSFDWGESLIANLAEGIVSAAASMLVRAMEFVGNIISMFLEAHSPPEAGPLSTINEWGKRLIDTYLQGFKNADFGVLKDISGIIKGALENLVEIGKIKELDLGPMLAHARTLVAKLIDTFNRTGEIAGSVLSEIQGMLGEAGDEIVRLLRLQLKYNKAVKDLEDLRRQRTDVTEAYDAEVRAIMRRTDITEAEKMNLIRQAKARKNLALDNIATEERAASKNVDSIKDQLDWQKEYIRSMQDQDDVWKDHLKILDKIRKSVGSVGRAIKSLADKIADLIKDLLEQLRVNKELQDIYESKGMDTTPLLREELNIRKRLVKALVEKGDLTKEEQGMLDANLSRIKELDSILGTTGGTDIPTIDTSGFRDSTDELIAGLKKVYEPVQSFSETLKQGQESLELFKRAMSGTSLEDMALEGVPESILEKLPSGDIETFVNSFKSGLSETQLMMIEWGNKIYDTKEKVVGTWEDLKSKWEAFTTGFSKNVNDISEKLGSSKFGEYFAGAQDVIVPALIAIAGAFLMLKGPLGFLLKWAGASSLFATIGSGLGVITGRLDKIRSISQGAGNALGGLTKKTLNLPKSVSAIGNAISGLGKKIGIVGISLATNFLPGFINLNKVNAKAGTSLAKLGAKFTSVSKPLAYLSTAWQWVISKVALFINKVPFLQKIFGNLGWGAMAAGGKIMKFAQPIIGLGSKLGGVASRLGFLGKILGLFGSVLSGLVGTGGSLAAFGALIAGIGGIMIALGAIVGSAIAYIIKNYDDFSDKIEETWDTIKGAVKGFVDSFLGAIGITIEKGESFGDVLNDIYEYIEPVAKIVANVLVGAFHALGNALGAVLPAIGAMLGGLINGIKTVAKAFIDLLSGKIDFGEFLKQAFGGILKGAGSILLNAGRAILGIVKAIVDEIADLLGDSWLGRVLKSISGFIGNIIAWFQKLFDKLIGHSLIPDLVNGIIGWFKKIAGPIKRVFGIILKALQPFFDAIGKFIKYIKIAFGFVKNAFKIGGMEAGLLSLLKVLGPLQKVFKPFIELVYRLWLVFKPLIDALASGFRAGGLSGAFEALKAVLPTILPLLGDLFKSLITAMPRALLGLAQVILPILGQAITSIAQFIIANAPAWWEAFKSLLGIVATGLWGWITESLLPWAGEMIGKIASFIAANAPGWWEGFKNVLGIVLSGLWAWVTGSLLPWAADMVAKVAQFIATNAPGWWEGFKTALGNIAIWLWGWITEVALPWIVSMFATVGAYIIKHGPEWLAKLKVVLGKLATGIKNWITSDAIPALSRLISRGVVVLAKIGTEWLAKIRTGLDKIKGRFRTVFEQISTIIKNLIKSAMNSMIGRVERGINRIVEGVNNLIEKVNTVAAAVGLPLIPLLSTVKLPRLARGGIVMSPMLSIVGDVTGGEAVLPLSKLDGIIASAISEASNAPIVTIEINNPTVRSEEDLNAIVNAVSRQLGTKLDARLRTLGVRGLNI